MTTTYPATLDTFVNPIATDALNSGTVPHTNQHDNLNDAVLAIETLLGVNATKILPIVAGKNAIINGGMEIAQRGTSFTSGALATPYYTLDRWEATRIAAVAGATITQQASGAPATFNNFMRLQRDSGNTTTNAISLGQSLETVNSIPFAGKLVTLSAWIRVGANYSATTAEIHVATGTGTDQNNFSATYAGLADTNITITPTTSWVRYSFTTTIPSTATELQANFKTSLFTGTAGANDYLDITGVQLELGSTATTFSRAGGSIGGETQLCRRYLPATYVNEIMGYSYAANSTVYGIVFDTPARVAPTGITTSGTFTAYSLNVGTSATPVLNQTSVNNGSVLVNAGITITAGQGSRLGGGGLILWTGCEL